MAPQTLALATAPVTQSSTMAEAVLLDLSRTLGSRPPHSSTTPNRRRPRPLRRLPPRPRRHAGDRNPNPRPHGLLHRRRPQLQVRCLLRRLALACLPDRLLLQLLPPRHLLLLPPRHPRRLPLRRDQFPHRRLGLAPVQVDSNREPFDRSRARTPPLRLPPLRRLLPVHLGHHLRRRYGQRFVLPHVLLLPLLLPLLNSSHLSFKTKQDLKYHGGEVPDENLILTPLESCIHTLYVLFFPLLFHIASHYSIVFSSAAAVSDLFLLFFIPFLFQLYASTRGALWWVTKNPNQLRGIQVMNGAVALVVVVISLEIRVVFHSFGRYIQVPPPMNYLLVTTTMLGGAAGAGAYALGMISDAFSSMAFTALAVVVSVAGAIVVGFPVLFLPLPSIAGFYLARFFTKKSVSSYFAFVVLGSLVVTWFVVHNFWDLNIWMAGMSLKSFCKLVIVNVVLAMSIPGLALLPSKLHFLIEIGLIGHALLVMHIENRFFNYSGIYYYGFEDDVMYPSYMVIVTTFVGLALVKRLSVDRRIGAKAVWILTCLYSAKLAMLLISSKSVVWVSAILLLAVTPPLLLYKDKSRTASKMKPWQGYAHAGVVTLSVWFCRETIFEALQWWNGRPPSDGLLLGFCIVLTGLACVPILALHFSHVLSAKRCLVLVVATGLLFILMQPPIPVSWTYRSDLIKAARQTADDISIYGFVAQKPMWPSWLLIVAILLTLAAVTSVIPIKYMVELRVFYSIAMGIALGIYISSEYFLQTAFLHVLIVVTMICASVFVVFTHFPSASSTKLLPWVFALLVALFPVTYLLEGQVRIKMILGDNGFGDMGEEEKKLTTLFAVEGARTSLLGLYAAIFMLIALEIKFELASLMREKATERTGIRHSQSGQSTSTSFASRMRFMQQRRAYYCRILHNQENVC
ncbi:uncharacterized protein Pyn_12514 [Prunus yedoensis var. nudiflora]|uniref:No exine formation 1 n=1 Tax=Prunus yedoensis var. nudiflora TaxID=2094558 RepID=A0A314XY27_PRUYE|nr:uncharacterized protein Pyn_12514 [Prunus yedoensis var. nudiflora]